MPSRRYGGSGGTTRRKHSLGNLRRAHPASGATWNVQVVRGKMSSKCLWHACRALILGLALMLLGAGMATVGYYADYLSMSSELRGNVTVRVKNDLKGFHLNNFSYVGPIVMGFGGFIVVASCVMTFEARDSAAKVMPARLRAGCTNKSTLRSNQSSSASQRRNMGMQLQNARWDQHFGVFRSSPAEAVAPAAQQPFDREALTAELIKFSKSLSTTGRFSPQLRRLTYTGSVPNLSTIHEPQSLAYSTNISHLLSPHHKLLPLNANLNNNKRHHRHHYHRHNHHHHHHHHQNNNYNNQHQQQELPNRRKQAKLTSSSVRCVKQTPRVITRIGNSSSLIQRATRESATPSGGICALLQPPSTGNRVYWQASSFDETAAARVLSNLASGSVVACEKRSERTRRSDTAQRHVLARQRPIEHEEERASPFGQRRNSTMSDSSYSGRWTARCASMTSRTSSIDSRRIQVDLHSPEVMPKSILRSPKRYSSGPSATPSVEQEFKSQLSVCSEPPVPVRQLSGQSSLEPCLPEEETLEIVDERVPSEVANDVSLSAVPELVHQFKIPTKKPRPCSLPLDKCMTVTSTKVPQLCRSNSSRTFYRPKPTVAKDRDDSIFYIRSGERDGNNDLYDSVQVINERRTTLLKADSENSLLLAERKLSSYSLKMPEITEREYAVELDDVPNTDTVLQLEPANNEQLSVTEQAGQWPIKD